MVCCHPSRIYISLSQEQSHRGIMTVPFQTKRNADADICSSFISSKLARCRLDLVLSDRLVSRVHSHAMFTHSMRAMLHQHRHKASFISISNRRGAADRVGHSLCYNCCEWQPHHVLFDIYSAQQSGMERNRSYDRIVRDVHMDGEELHDVGKQAIASCCLVYLTQRQDVPNNLYRPMGIRGEHTSCYTIIRAVSKRIVCLCEPGHAQPYPTVEPSPDDMAAVHIRSHKLFKHSRHLTI